jgi:hypothetical protein
MFRYFGLYSNACSLCTCPGDDLGTVPVAFKSCGHPWRNEDAARAAVLAAQGGPALSEGAPTCEDLRIKPVWVRLAAKSRFSVASTTTPLPHPHPTPS